MEIYTNYKLLLHVFSQPTLHSKYVCWVSIFSAFNIFMYYLLGSNNTTTDVLSHMILTCNDLIHTLSLFILHYLEMWFHNIIPHLSTADCIDATTVSLQHSQRLSAPSCPSCTHQQFDRNTVAIRKHIVSTCPTCYTSIKITPTT